MIQNKSEFRLNLLSLLISFLAMLTAVGSLLFAIRVYSQQERITVDVSCSQIPDLSKVQYEDSNYRDFYRKDSNHRDIFQKDLVFFIHCTTTNISSKKVGIESIFYGIDTDIERSELGLTMYQSAQPIFSKEIQSLPLLLDIGEQVAYNLKVRWALGPKEAETVETACPNLIKGQSTLMEAYCCLKRNKVDLNESNITKRIAITVMVAGSGYGRVYPSHKFVTPINVRYPFSAMGFSTTVDFQNFYCSPH